MLPSLASVDWSRGQFALDASFHFLFVPLTLGMTWILFTMELAYVLTGKTIYQDMTKFWGKLFGINFAVGVLTGLTMEFQFGTNWAYYSQFVGDIFGTPLAIEGLVAFMLESTFLGLFFFGWDKLSKKQHLMSTFCLAIGSSLSALLILVANGFMQHPVGAYFDFNHMRMQTSNLWQLILNPFAQIGFAHTVIAGYTTGAMFVLGISSYYLLKGRDLAFAKRSFAIAAGFGLVASLMVIIIGDQNGLLVARFQKEKLAAIEAEWTTQAPPASFNLFAFPNQKDEKNYDAIKIPGLLGLLATHSRNAVIPGIKQLIQEDAAKIKKGILAVEALEKIRKGDETPSVLMQFKKYEADYGYGLLLSRYTNHIGQASPAEIEQAARNTVPNVFTMFWTFRVMVGLGFLFLFSFITAVVYAIRQDKIIPKWVLTGLIYSIPLPFIASLCGWFVTEHGRQPWVVFGILPTDFASSALSAIDVGLSFMIFLALYGVLFAIELYLMLKYAKLGPSAIHTGSYHFEQLEQAK